MSIQLLTAVYSNMGCVRKNNEDNFFLNGKYMDESNRDAGGLFAAEFGLKDRSVFAVCDGMGGTARGEDASFCAVQKLAEFSNRRQEFTSRSVIGPVLENANNEIYRRFTGSGTTIAMVTCCDGWARISHVGDSRVYSLQDGRIINCTEDQSLVMRLYKMGKLTKEELRTDKRKNQISQYLGMPQDEITLSPAYSDRFELKVGMGFLICSDGLSDMVTDEEIQNIVSRSSSPKTIVKMLGEAALKNGGRDNVTVMYVYVGDDSDPERTQKLNARDQAAGTERKEAVKIRRLRNTFLIFTLISAAILIVCSMMLYMKIS